MENGSLKASGKTWQQQRTKLDNWANISKSNIQLKQTKININQSSIQHPLANYHISWLANSTIVVIQTTC